MKNVYEYSEVSLGKASEQKILKRILTSCGFRFSGETEMKGLSGHEHQIDAIGIRGTNIVLALSGPKDLGLRLKENGGISLPPKYKAEIWCRDALFRMYDISAYLNKEGYNVDLFLFENQLTDSAPNIVDFGFATDVNQWAEKNNLPKDWLGNWSTSLKSIEIPESNYLLETGRSSGACYLGLNNLTLEEISRICGEDEAVASEHTKAAMLRIRVDQYFNPPTDELILGSLSHSKRHDKKFVEEIYETSISLSHKPTENVLVSEVDYTDPIQTAIALQDMGSIDYSAEIHISDSGKEAVFRINKTAQENFIIRVLKVMNIPGIVKAAIEGLKGE